MEISKNGRKCKSLNDGLQLHCVKRGAENHGTMDFELMK